MSDKKPPIHEYRLEGSGPFRLPVISELIAERTLPDSSQVVIEVRCAAVQRIFLTIGIPTLEQFVTRLSSAPPSPFAKPETAGELIHLSPVGGAYALPPFVSFHDFLRIGTFPGVSFVTATYQPVWFPLYVFAYKDLLSYTKAAVSLSQK